MKMTRSRGFVLLEIMVALGLAVMVLVAITGLLIHSLKVVERAKGSVTANGLLTESDEALKFLARTQWSGLHMGTFHPNFLSPQGWVLAEGAEEVVLNGITYTRSIQINEVRRSDEVRGHAVGGIVSQGGYLDSDTWSATVLLTWRRGEDEQSEITRTRYLSRLAQQTVTHDDWLPQGQGYSTISGDTRITSEGKVTLSASGIKVLSYAAHWELNETGGSLNDTSSNKNTLQAQGSLGYAQPGVSDTAITFVGGHGALQDANQRELDGEGLLAIKVWVKKDRYSADDYIFSKWEGSNNGSYRLYVKNNGSLRFEVQGESEKAVVFSPPNMVSLGRWTEVMALYDGVSLRLYVGGNEVATESYGGGVSDSLAAVRAGAGTSGGSFDGTIDALEVIRALPSVDAATFRAALLAVPSVGMLESATIDAGVSNPLWRSVAWRATGGGVVKVQLAASENGTSWNYGGPDGTPTSYYTNADGELITKSLSGRYLRYKVILEGTETIVPQLNFLTLLYAK